MHRTQRFRDWAKNRPPAFVWAAGMVAGACKEVAWALKRLKEDGWIDLRGPVPPIDVWLDIYKTDVWRGLMVKALNMSEEEADLCLSSQEIIKQWTQMTEEERRTELTSVSDADWQEIRTYITSVIRDGNHSVEACITDTDIPTPAEGMRLAGIAELHFLLLVYLPCWFLYRRTPQALFAEACKGNTASLAKLLRVDKGILAEPTIAEHIRQLQVKHAHNDLGKIARSLGERPGGKVSPTRVKNAMVGLVAKMAETLHHEITEPEIRELFDAIATAQRGELRDRSLPMLPDSLSRTIRRERKNWPGLSGGQN